MQIRMNVGQAVEFLKNHGEAIECAPSDSWLEHVYDLKLACAIETVLIAMEEVKKMYPKVLGREHIEEFKIVNKWL